MDDLFLLSLLLVVSGSLCTGNNSYSGTGSSLAVCQPDACTLLSEVAAMREKLAATAEAQRRVEQNLDTVRQKVATVEANAQFYKSQTEELWKKNEAQDAQLRALSDIVAARTSKVAFSAALGVPVGPFDQDTPLKYQRILSNIGSGYNPATGIFTATVGGMYYFRYTMFNNMIGPPNSVVSLMRNGERWVSSWDTQGEQSHDSASNAAVMQLEAGDGVFVQLSAHRVVDDDRYHANTFSGFLLFIL